MRLDPLLDLLVPHRCVACGARCDPPWCTRCAAAAAAVALETEAACRTCALDHGAGDVCWQGASPVRRLVAAFRYTGPVADAIVAGKVGGAHAVWAPLGRQLAARCDADAVDVVAWVPAPASRRRARGFDHARLLADAAARALDRPVAGLLRAPRHLPDRGRVDAAHRAPLPSDAYAGPDRLRGRVLLIDDVVTTGATLAAAAGVLSEAGGTVSAAVVARAGSRPLGPARVRPAGPG